MTEGREIRSYDYVNHPYSRVREVLIADPASVFREATRGAASRAESVAAQLRVNLGGLEVGADIALDVGSPEDEGAGGDAQRITRIPVAWKAAQRPRLFPLMSAVLSIYPLTATETQLDFLGRYQPPLGMVGGALDAVAGHRIAEATVHRLVSDVARYLRTHIA